VEYKSIRDWFSGAAQMFSARNSALQISALPCRTKNGSLEVCLITSRGGGRWIVPKGWPEADLNHIEVAAQEAWEEAGLTGTVSPDLYASYAATKELEPGIGIPVRIDVYLLINPRQAKKFPELGQRRIKWLAIDKAAERVDEDGLKNVLLKLQSEGLPA
jgi:8-oxo-dGTP pyrophosphatase MutT (NUDIX family)